MGYLGYGDHSWEAPTFNGLTALLTDEVVRKGMGITLQESAYRAETRGGVRGGIGVC